MMNASFFYVNKIIYVRSWADQNAAGQIKFKSPAVRRCSGIYEANTTWGHSWAVYSDICVICINYIELVVQTNSVVYLENLAF